MIFTSCTKPKNEENYIENIPLKSSMKCYNPDDIIIKWNDLDKHIFSDLLIAFVQEEIPLSDMLRNDLLNLCNERIFGHRPYTIEWQLYDDDFCQFLPHELVNGMTHETLFVSTIPICNSVLNKDVMQSGSWVETYDNFRIHIELCSEITNSLGFVPYYEVVQFDGETPKLSLTNSLHKSYANTSINVTMKKRGTDNSKTTKLFEGSSIIYSGDYGQVDKVQDTSKISKIKGVI